MPAPPEPDFIFNLDTSCLGLEVAHLFGSERDARRLLGRAWATETTREAEVEHAMMPLNVRVPSELSRILAQKAGKTYPRPTWLLVCNAYPLWDRADFQMYPEVLNVPSSHPF